jgi:hypothetical protein
MSFCGTIPFPLRGNRARAIRLIFVFGIFANSFSAAIARAETVRPLQVFHADHPLPIEQIKMNPDTADVLVIETGGSIFRLPMPYAIGRRLKYEPTEILHLAQFQFAFWMPDGRPTERDAGSLIGYRPKESKHPNPGPDEYIVRVVPAEVVLIKDSEYVAAGGGRYTPPQGMFRNNNGTNGFLTNETNFKIEQVSGLIAYVPKDKNFPRTIYRTPEDAETQAFIQCDMPGQERKSLFCLANVFYPDQGLAFRLQFPSEKIEDWKSVAELALKLSESWRSK